ncbi:hypothetical protein [Devosia aurantiaca]|nr:hypothetical protein [Devosia aurantiaca]
MARAKKIIELMNGLAQKKVTILVNKMAATSPTSTRKMMILTR